MIINYHGKLGTFKYNNKKFQIVSDHLCYIGSETDGSKIKIPEGILDCSYMFMNSKIKTPPIIPEGVTNCEGMFARCTYLEIAPVIPDNVQDCGLMFLGCTSLIEAPAIPKSVFWAHYMFSDCISLIEGPTIPESVASCAYMFKNCRALKNRPTLPYNALNRDAFSGCPKPIVEINNITSVKTEESFDICDTCRHKDLCLNPGCSQAIFLDCPKIKVTK